MTVWKSESLSIKLKRSKSTLLSGSIANVTAISVRLPQKSGVPWLATRFATKLIKPFTPRGLGTFLTGSNRISAGNKVNVTRKAHTTPMATTLPNP